MASYINFVKREQLESLERPIVCNGRCGSKFNIFVQKVIERIVESKEWDPKIHKADLDGNKHLHRLCKDIARHYDIDIKEMIMQDFKSYDDLIRDLITRILVLLDIKSELNVYQNTLFCPDFKIYSDEYDLGRVCRLFCRLFYKARIYKYYSKAPYSLVMDMLYSGSCRHYQQSFVKEIQENLPDFDIFTEQMIAKKIEHEKFNLNLDYCYMLDANEILALRLLNCQFVYDDVLLKHSDQDYCAYNRLQNFAYRAIFKLWNSQEPGESINLYGTLPSIIAPQNVQCINCRSFIFASDKYDNPFQNQTILHLEEKVSSEEDSLPLIYADISQYVESENKRYLFVPMLIHNVIQDKINDNLLKCSNIRPISYEHIVYNIKYFNPWDYNPSTTCFDDRRELIRFLKCDDQFSTVLKYKVVTPRQDLNNESLRIVFAIKRNEKPRNVTELVLYLEEPCFRFQIDLGRAESVFHETGRLRICNEYNKRNPKWRMKDHKKNLVLESSVSDPSLLKKWILELPEAYQMADELLFEEVEKQESCKDWRCQECRVRQWRGLMCSKCQKDRRGFNTKSLIESLRKQYRVWIISQQNDDDKRQQEEFSSRMKDESKMSGDLMPGGLMSGGLMPGGLMSGGLMSGGLMSGGLMSGQFQQSNEEAIIFTFGEQVRAFCASQQGNPQLKTIIQSFSNIILCFIVGCSDNPEYKLSLSDEQVALLNSFNALQYLEIIGIHKEGDNLVCSKKQNIVNLLNGALNLMENV